MINNEEMVRCRGKSELRRKAFPGSGNLHGRPKRRRAGFTLVELLVVVTITAILAGLSVVGVFKAMDIAGGIKESAAAKTLITAYLTAATDNDGYFIPGYDRTASVIELPEGGEISGMSAYRYPYRLAPYFNYDIKGALLTSNNSSIAQTNHYMVSAYPSFGINYLLVGGNINSVGALTSQSECLQMAGQGRGAPILVFATASGAGSVPGVAGAVQGYCKLEPPHFPDQPSWSSATWTKDSNPMDYGQVDARHGERAICAFSDGSVRKLAIEELRDMRLWSFRAAAANDPDYTVGTRN